MTSALKQADLAGPGIGEAILGEVSVSIWPEVLKEMCAAREIRVLE